MAGEPRIVAVLDIGTAAADKTRRTAPLISAWSFSCPGFEVLHTGDVYLLGLSGHPFQLGVFPHFAIFLGQTFVGQGWSLSLTPSCGSYPMSY